MSSQFDGLLTEWHRSGLVTADAAETMQKDWHEASVARARHRWTVLLSTLGAGLLGIAAISFIAENWEHMSPSVKVALAVIITLLSYAAGLFLVLKRPTFEGTGRALIFLACLLLGATLALISQIYHLTGAPYGLTGLWALAIAPVVYLLRHRAVGVIFVLLLGMTALLYIGSAPGLGIEDLLDLSINLFQYIPSVMLICGLALSLGLLHLQTDWAPTGRVFLALGVSIFLFFLYWLTFPDLVHELLMHTTERPHSDALIMRLAIMTGAAYVLALFALWRIGKWRDGAIIFGCLFVATFLSWFFLFVSLHIKGPDSSLMFLLPVWAVAANLAFAGFAFGLYKLGLIWSRPWMIQLGSLAIIAFVIGKYVQLFGNLLDVTLFYLLGGLLLIFMGVWLERQRRHARQTAEVVT